ncbi:MAG TPA: hypothetical protein VFW16_14225 [Streptosporangiaceae bacterium]|nr:hypothetical protein [Streptosporangiaceae bacterium]
MTDHQRDPIEAWLSRDVELLPPPPGAFERVHRRARHRRTMKAVTAAAGAVVVIVAGVTVPKIVSGLSTTPQPPTAKVYLPSKPAPAAPARLALSGPPFLTAGAGPEPAAGFRPTSVTFVGNTLGAVLGLAGSCATGPCTAMAGTHDYGTTWTEIAAPPAGPPDGTAGVSQVRFHDGKNGWAYGPALYATHDGGKTWHAISTKGRRVVDLSTVGSRAFAVLATGCTGTGAQFGTGCTGFRLFSTPKSADRWQSVAGAAGAGLALPGGLQLTGHGGYLIAGGHLFAGPVTSGSWNRVRGPAETPRCLAGPGSRPALIAPGTDHLFLVCQDQGTGVITLYGSIRGGSSWQRRSTVHAMGIAQSLAVSPGGALMLATTTGIYRSANARTWKPASVAAPSGGFSFVGMTTDTNGVAIASTPGHAVYITTDGGLTWRAVPIQ